jgi:predicted signal transduction protein with EAL and GGDEF domain
MAQRILTELAAPIRTHGHILTITASVGVAQRRDEDDAQALLRHADIAMYAAKKRGKGTYAQYTSDLSGLLLAPESRLGDLRRAVAELRPPFALEVGRAALVCPGFAADLVALLDAAGIAPAGLTLVIPAAQISDEDAVRGVLRELRAAGLGLALDHTGNRQVRLDLLAALPFTRLILDPSFFKGGDRRQEALTDAVIRFAQDAGIEYEAATLQESAL